MQAISTTDRLVIEYCAVTNLNQSVIYILTHDLIHIEYDAYIVDMTNALQVI